MAKISISKTAKLLVKIALALMPTVGQDHVQLSGPQLGFCPQGISGNVGDAFGCHSCGGGCTVAANAYWCNHYVKQYGGSSKVST